MLAKTEFQALEDGDIVARLYYGVDDKDISRAFYIFLPEGGEPHTGEIDVAERHLVADFPTLGRTVTVRFDIDDPADTLIAKGGSVLLSLVEAGPRTRVRVRPRKEIY